MAGRKQAGDSWRAASLRLGQLIRRARHARQQSQEGVARRAGLATSTVRKIESNSIQEPGVFTVLALMDALDVPFAELQALLRPDSAVDTAEEATFPG